MWSHNYLCYIKKNAVPISKSDSRQLTVRSVRTLLFTGRPEEGCGQARTTKECYTMLGLASVLTRSLNHLRGVSDEAVLCHSLGMNVGNALKK